jgi:hypothetical protein
MRHILLSIAALAPATLGLAGCSTRQPVEPAPVAALPPPAPVAAAPTHNWLAVPPRLADGSYATPNRSVSAAGAIWHLRAGLNVAALGCRGLDEAALVAGYNRLLADHRAEFADAYRTLSREHADAAAFDTAMTRLYNYYALPPAQAGLCDAARAVLTELATLPAGSLASQAPAALQRLDAPFVALFQAQDQWATTRIAARAPVATAIRAVAPAPRIAIDHAVLLQP